MYINDIRPFVPAKDYQESRLFYSALGFDMDDAGPNLSILTKDSVTFFLRGDCDEASAENIMLQLIVKDLDEVFELLSTMEGLNIKHSPITEERWGSVVYLWGPSGELWHITELKES